MNYLAQSPSGYFFLVTLALMLITVVTRFLPFWLKPIFERSMTISKVGRILPGTIMLLLVFHTMEDVHWTSYPHGMPELSCIGLALTIYFFSRNLMASLLPSATLYLILVNFLLLPGQ